MGRALGAVAVVFSVGAAAMKLMSPWLGSTAECAALGVVGLGLMVSSHVMSRRHTHPTTGAAVGRELETDG